MKTRTAPVAVSLALAVSLAAGACGSSISDEVAPDKQKDKDLAAVVATGIPGASLLVWDGGSTNKVAFGVGEVSRKVPLKVDDRFRIGSLAKTYVSVVMLQLVDEKRLGLDDSIEKFVPKMVPNGAQITVRQLLNHISGVPNYEEHPSYMAPYMAGDLGHVTTPAQLVAMGTSFGSWFAPGTSSRYSNTNYTLAGLIIEKVTGSTLGEQGAIDVTNFSPSIAWAGGGIVSTTTDVSTFYRALLEGRLLPPELLEQMMTTVVDDKNGLVYGLGIERKELPCGTVWGHQGNFPGYLMESFAIADAAKQITTAYSLDSTSMDPAQGEATLQLRTDAFCGVKP